MPGEVSAHAHADLARVAVDFSAPAGKILPLREGEENKVRALCTTRKVTKIAG